MPNPKKPRVPGVAKIGLEAARHLQDQDWDALTTSQIAEILGVSRRGLSRHYPTKASLMFPHVSQYQNYFLEKLEDLLPRTSFADSMMIAAKLTAARPCPDHEMVQLRARIIARSKLLQQHQAQFFADFASRVQAAVMNFFVAEALPQVTKLIHATSGGVFGAWQVWLSQPDPDALPHLVTDVIRMFTREFAALEKFRKPLEPAP